MTIISTQIKYPVLLCGKYGISKFYESMETMVENTFHLKLMSKMGCGYVIDSEFNKYRVKRFEKVCGIGRFKGYYLEGPFLHQKVVFKMELELQGRATVLDAAKVFAKKGRKSEDLSKKQADELQRLLEEEAAREGATLASLYECFERFSGWKEVDV